jgi:hypothetical protein
MPTNTHLALKSHPIEKQPSAPSPLAGSLGGAEIEGNGEAAADILIECLIRHRRVVVPEGTSVLVLFADQ